MKKNTFKILLLLFIGAGVMGAAIWIWGDSIREFLKPVGPSGTTLVLDGTITFGRAISPDGRSVEDPATTFRLGEDIAWVVQFEKGVRAEELVVELHALTGDGREIYLDSNKMEVEPSDEGVYNLTSSKAFWSMAPRELAGNTHTFRVKYLRGGGVAAQGDFSILSDGSAPAGFP